MAFQSFINSINKILLYSWSQPEREEKSEKNQARWHKHSNGKKKKKNSSAINGLNWPHLTSQIIMSFMSVISLLLTEVLCLTGFTLTIITHMHWHHRLLPQKVIIASTKASEMQHLLKPLMLLTGGTAAHAGGSAHRAASMQALLFFQMVWMCDCQTAATLCISCPDYLWMACLSLHPTPAADLSSPWYDHKVTVLTGAVTSPRKVQRQLACLKTRFICIHLILVI